MSAPELSALNEAVRDALRKHVEKAHHYDSQITGKVQEAQELMAQLCVCNSRMEDLLPTARSAPPHPDMEAAVTAALNQLGRWFHTRVRLLRVLLKDLCTAEVLFMAADILEELRRGDRKACNDKQLTSAIALLTNIAHKQPRRHGLPDTIPAFHKKFAVDIVQTMMESGELPKNVIASDLNKFCKSVRQQ